MSHTLAQLRRELARSLDSYVTGTVTGGDTLTLVDDQLLKSGQYRSEFFAGADLYIVDAGDVAPQGEARYVVSFDAATGTATVGMPFSAVVAAGMTYELYKLCTVEELNQALMFAVKDWNFMSSSTVISTNAEYVITCPGLVTADQISGVWIRRGSDGADDYEPLSNYRLWMNKGTINLELQNRALLGAEYYFRVEFQARYDQLKDQNGDFLDVAVVGGDLAKMVLEAKRYFYDRRMNSANGTDREWYAQLLTFTVEQMDKDIEPPRRPTRRAQQEDYGWH